MQSGSNVSDARPLFPEEQTPHRQGYRTDRAGSRTLPPGRALRIALLVAGVLLGLAVLAISGGAHAASVSVDDSSSDAGQASSFTIPHATGDGSDRLMLVSVTLLDKGSAKEVGTVTYNGTSLTEAANVEGTDFRVQVFQLIAPDVGTADVVVDLEAENKAGIGVVTYFGVDQSDPLGPVVTDDGSGTSSTLTVSSATDDMVVDHIGTDKTLTGPGSGQTQRYIAPAETGKESGGSTEPGASSVDMSWTLDESGKFTHVAFNVSAGSDTTAPTVDAITTLDRDGDGKVDAADVVFTEPIDDSTITPSDWAMEGTSFEAVSTGASADDDTVQLRITTDGNEIDGTGAKDVTYTQGSTADLAGNLLADVASGDVAEVSGSGGGGGDGDHRHWTHADVEAEPLETTDPDVSRFGTPSRDMAAGGWFNVTFDDPTIDTVSVRVADHTHGFELRIDAGNVAGLPATPDGFQAAGHVRVTAIAADGETPEVEEMIVDLSPRTPDGIDAAQVTALGLRADARGWTPLDAVGDAGPNDTVLRVTADGTRPLLIAFDVAPPNVRLPGFADVDEMLGTWVLVTDNRGISEVDLTVDGQTHHRLHVDGARTLRLPSEIFPTAEGDLEVVATDVSGLVRRTSVAPALSGAGSDAPTVGVRPGVEETVISEDVSPSPFPPTTVLSTMVLAGSLVAIALAFFGYWGWISGVPGRSPTLRVLLVEDDPGHVRLVEAALERSDAGPFELAATDRLGSGMAAMADGDLDVVLLDLTLPDSTGIDTLDRVLSAHPELPVVVLTGMSDNKLAEEAIRLGAKQDLVKGSSTHTTLGRVLRRAAYL